MARSTDAKKLALWQGRFRRLADSGLSVVQFCAVEGVSEASFYYWQKKLGPTSTRRRRACAKNRSIDADGHGRAGSESRRAGATGRGVFKPVTVVPGLPGVVVVRLPGGTRIEVDASHLDAVQAVLAVTVRGDHDRAAGQEVPSDSHVIGERGGAVSC